MIPATRPSHALGWNLRRKNIYINLYGPAGTSPLHGHISRCSLESVLYFRDILQLNNVQHIQDIDVVTMLGYVGRVELWVLKLDKIFLSIKYWSLSHLCYLESFDF